MELEAIVDLRAAAVAAALRAEMEKVRAAAAVAMD